MPDKKDSARRLVIRKDVICPNTECVERFRVGINPKTDQITADNLYYCYGCKREFAS